MSRQKEVTRFLTVTKEALPAFLIAGNLTFNIQIASAAPDQQQINPSTNCPTGEDPHFVLGFKELKNVVGDEMGDPLECEHGRPDNKDTNQRTSKGLAYWRENVNEKTFTDGFRHWAEAKGIYVYWEGQDVESPANAIQVIEQSPKPQTLESFVKSSILMDQITLDDKGQSKLEIRSSANSTFSATLNQSTREQLGKLLAESAVQNNYRNIEVISTKSPADTPVEWESPGMVQANLGYFRGTNILELYPIGSFNAVRSDGDLLLFFALRPDLNIADPAVVRAVNDTIAQKLFTAALYNGNLSAPNALFGKTDFLQLASQDALQISSFSPVQN